MSEIKDGDLKWATMIPLIGGSAIGCKNATGTAPVFNLSYSAFSKNEVHLKRYWPDVPHLTIDSDSLNMNTDGLDLDFVNSVCPCSGLSMLNVSRTGQSARGSDAVQNSWMLDSAKYVLSSLRPKVLWGENAPGLFDNPGRDLVAKLRTLGQEHGYTFSMVKTNSELHGLPQRRVRTFYFFWRSPTVPILEWKQKQSKTLEEYLAEIPSWASLQDVFLHEGKASETYLPYKFVLERERMTHAEFSKKIGRGTINRYLEKNFLIEECLNWLKKYHPTEVFLNYGNRTFVAMLEHIKNKLTQGLGYWDDSVKFMGTYFSAVISKNIVFAVHPSEDRFFNVRELLHLMGMPHDYQIDSIKNINHICQNVPVNTAQDWAEEVIKFCKGKAEMSLYTFLKQDNTTQEIVEAEGDSENCPTIKIPEASRGKKRKIPRVTKETLSKMYKKETKKMKTELKHEIDEFKIEAKQEIKGELLEDLSLFIDKRINFIESFMKKEEKNVIDSKINPISHEIMKNEKNIKDSENKRLLNQVDIQKIDDIDEIVVEKEFGLKDRFGINKLIGSNNLAEDEDDEIKLVEYQCAECEFKALSKKSLQVHWTLNCGKLSYKCGVCSNLFKSQSMLSFHWEKGCLLSQ